MLNKKYLVLCVMLISLIFTSCAKTEEISMDETTDTEDIGEISDGGPVQIEETKAVTLSLDDQVGAAIIEYNKEMYLEGECKAEAHEILGKEETEEEIIVYALTMYGEYAMEDGKFKKISGSGTIPAVITFEKTEDGYLLNDLQYPTDGSDYDESINELFPKKYHKNVLSISDAKQEEMKEKELKYPKEYLESIGSNAEIVG